MKTLAIAVLGACLIGAGHAADIKSPMNPGLWEVTSKMQSDDPKIAKAMEEAQKAMANMPPEQRKMMEDMMRKQGVQMSAGAAGETKITMCVTAEMIKQSVVPQQQMGKCTSKATQNGSGFKTEFTCTEPVSSGVGNFVFTGGDAYTMDMKMTNGAGAKAQRMTIMGNAKRLGADCGDVKPFVMPK